ncbi:TlyA family RNA methyltransferase [Hoeflea sp.]|uniref:TlyA family RNA methyltransferase n=1 Tax=Hoeflea sp. TaxID=1940281 RepID=UPI003B013D92
MTADQTKTGDKLRLDLVLVQQGHFETRARARDAVARGTVSVDGTVCKKPGIRINPGADLSVSDRAQSYVSRAALKLIAGLEAFGFDPGGRSVIDLGASTGGFSQVLLERGASQVLAVDVGHDQLHPVVRDNPRLVSFEGLNARHLTQAGIGGRAFDAVVSDVSFISLRLALPPSLALAENGSFCVLLVKPQFEAGKDGLGKGGLLKDPARGPEIAAELSDWLGSQAGWRSVGVHPSPIEGGDGNREFLLGGIKQ